MKRVLTTIVFLFIAAPVLAQTPAAPTDRFAWEQDGPSLAAVNAYRVDVELDKVVLPTPATPTCTGTASPFLCRAALPAMTTGVHTARVRVVDTTSITSLLFSDWSNAATFTMRAVPGAPRNVRVEAVPAGGGDNADAGLEVGLGHIAEPGGGQ